MCLQEEFPRVLLDGEDVHEEARAPAAADGERAEDIFQGDDGGAEEDDFILILEELARVPETAAVIGGAAGALECGEGGSEKAMYLKKVMPICEQRWEWSEREVAAREWPCRSMASARNWANGPKPTMPILRDCRRIIAGEVAAGMAAAAANAARLDPAEERGSCCLRRFDLFCGCEV